jgi:hypothetical protein
MLGRRLMLVCIPPIQIDYARLPVQYVYPLDRSIKFAPSNLQSFRGNAPWHFAGKERRICAKAS